jgi:hypothetical protein
MGSRELVRVGNRQFHSPLFIPFHEIYDPNKKLFAIAIANLYVPPIK